MGMSLSFRQTFPTEKEKCNCFHKYQVFLSERQSGGFSSPVLDGLNMVLLPGRGVDQRTSPTISEFPAFCEAETSILYSSNLPWKQPEMTPCYKKVPSPSKPCLGRHLGLEGPSPLVILSPCSIRSNQSGKKLFLHFTCTSVSDFLSKLLFPASLVFGWLSGFW